MPSEAIERLLRACDALLEYRGLGMDHGECVCAHCQITEAAAAVRAEFAAEPVPDGELLPCPFCGGPATVCQSSNDPRWWSVLCSGPCEVLPTCDVASREGAISSWNRRAELARETELSDDELKSAYFYGAWSVDAIGPDHVAGLRAVARAARGDR